MELVLAIAAGLLVFGFVGYKLYQSQQSKPSKSVGGRTQSTNPSREIEREVEEKLDRKTKSTRSAKPRKSTPRKSAPKKSTAKKSTGRSKNVKSKG